MSTKLRRSGCPQFAGNLKGCGLRGQPLPMTKDEGVSGAVKLSLKMEFEEEEHKDSKRA